jgi:NADPH2:quinone reductase
MKALVCDRFGSLDDIHYRDIGQPVPGPGEILVRVRSAGAVFTDVLFALGRYQSTPPLPFILGTEVAGTVAALGPGVSRFAVGDRIASVAIEFGGFAEYLVLPEWLPTALPATVGFQVGAALMSSAATAQHALRQRASVRRGETLVVTGAAGGTGSAAVQVGKAIGARVVAVCSSERRARFCRELGADATVLYPTRDLREDLHEATGGLGADVVFDTVGGDVFDACARAMAYNGRLLVVGFASGRLPTLPVNRTLLGVYSVIGVHWLSFVRRQPALHAANMDELMGWAERGTVVPRVTRTLPMSDGVAALTDLAERRALGKIVLIP